MICNIENDIKFNILNNWKTKTANIYIIINKFNIKIKIDNL